MTFKDFVISLVRSLHRGNPEAYVEALDELGLQPIPEPRIITDDDPELAIKLFWECRT